MPNTSTISGPLFKVLASPFLGLQQALSIGDDCWSWTTLSGEVYEDVELLSLAPDKVTIRHGHGVATIARTDLPREIQQRLIDNSEMAEPDFADERHEAPANRAASFSKAIQR